MLENDAMLESNDDDILTLADQIDRFSESLSPTERRLLSEILRGSVIEILGEPENGAVRECGTLLITLHAGLRDRFLSRLAREAGGRDGV